MHLNNIAYQYLGVSYSVHAFKHSYVSSIAQQKGIGKLNDAYLVELKLKVDSLLLAMEYYINSPTPTPPPFNKYW